jgi:O-succinylbenzoate synthase
MTHKPTYKFYRYALPMRDGSLRRGFLVICKTDGADGWGEIAPLDGYSRESIAEVEREITRAGSSKLASIRCGMEFAEAACRAKLSGQSLVSYFGGGAENIQVATLVTGAERDIPKTGVIKLKVGKITGEAVAKLMADHPSARFRLDANRAWSLQDALTFCRAIDPARVEFVEEPLKNYSDYDAFNFQSPVGFALDESLMDYAPRDWNNLRALVVKPSLHGLNKSIELISWAYRAGKYAVVSAMYESGVGIRQLAALAAAKTPGVAAGLDTYSRLLGDVAMPRVAMHDGRMKTDTDFAVDLNKLELMQ